MTQAFNSATDFRKSLESRLKNLALARNQDLQRLRRKVAFDRLLARLFSEQEPQFFLKGGYAMELRLSTARATKDIDLTSLRRIDQRGNPISHVLLSDLRTLARKDLIDMILLSQIRPLDLRILKSALDQVFKVRRTHALPRKLEPPPVQWHGPYVELANECSLSLSLDEAFAEVVKIQHSIIE